MPPKLKFTVLPQVWLGAVPRSECESSARPCERDCRYRLRPPGRALSLEDLRPPSCAIDIADDGPKSLREVAQLMGISNPMVQKIQNRAMRKLAAHKVEIFAVTRGEG